MQLWHMVDRHHHHRELRWVLYIPLHLYLRLLLQYHQPVQLCHFRVFGFRRRRCLHRRSRRCALTKNGSSPSSASKLILSDSAREINTEGWHTHCFSCSRSFLLSFGLSSLWTESPRFPLCSFQVPSSPAYTSGPATYIMCTATPLPPCTSTTSRIFELHWCSQNHCTRNANRSSPQPPLAALCTTPYQCLSNFQVSYLIDRDA